MSVGSADINGDGHADILVAANNANAHVKAFSGVDGSQLASFFAFPGFMGPMSVTGGDFNHNGSAQIVVGAGGSGVGGRIAIFNPDGSLYNGGFFAFPGFGGSITVATGDITGSGTPAIIVGAGPGAPGGHVEAFSGVDFSLLGSFLALDAALGPGGDTEGVLVGAGDATGDGFDDILVVPAGNPLMGPVAFDGTTGAIVSIPSSNYSPGSSFLQ